MTDDEKKQEAPKESPVMGQVVGYLKDYPFLLITVAGLIIMSGILIFEIEKLKEFKWLIYAVVLVPLAIQFLIEFKKLQPRVSNSPGSGAAIPTAAQTTTPENVIPMSMKAWTSVGICVFLFGVVATSDEIELYDKEFALGFLIFALAAGGVALSALSDIKQRRTQGKGTAITGMVLALLLALAGIGWMTTENDGTARPEKALDKFEALSPDAISTTTPGSVATAARATTPSLEGRYQLFAHYVDGVSQASGGTLAVSRQATDRFLWQAQLTTQNFSGMHTLSYAGQFQQRGDRWFMRISSSNDPTWRDHGETPMEITFDGENAAFGYQYDGNFVQTAWIRSQ